MKFSSQMLGLFEKYCNINTSFKDGRYYVQVLDLLESVLKEINFKIKRVDIPQKIAGGKNRVNLIAKLHLDKKLPTLIIYNHIDVVPAEYKEAFKFQIKNGRAYARGAADHKGSTMAILDALSKIKVKNLRFNLIFLLTTDEETDQFLQLEYLKKYLTIDSNNSYCFDPDTFAGGVTTSHLGLYEFKIKTFGKSVHSGVSHLGFNAIESLMKAYPLLRDINQKYLSLESNIKSFPKDGKIFTVKSGLNMSVIKGGIGTCIVPDKAELDLDLRLAPELNLVKESKWIKSQVNDFFVNKGIEFEMSDGIMCEGYTSNHAEIDKFEQILRQESGESGQYCVMGSTPVADWTKKMAIPHFGLGVARYESNVHGVNENCKLKDLETLSNVFLKYITH